MHNKTGMGELICTEVQINYNNCTGSKLLNLIIWPHNNDFTPSNTDTIQHIEYSTTNTYYIPKEISIVLKKLYSQDLKSSNVNCTSNHKQKNVLPTFRWLHFN